MRRARRGRGFVGAATAAQLASRVSVGITRPLRYSLCPFASLAWGDLRRAFANTAAVSRRAGCVRKDRVVTFFSGRVGGGGLAARRRSPWERETVGVSGLVGRQREMVELVYALDRLLAGEGGLVLVSGEAGIGKTRLGEELALAAAARDVTVAWVRCWEAATTPPFWPWIQLLQQLTGATMPDARPLSPGDDPGLARLRFFDDVVARVRSVATGQPLLLVVDDLQWADVASVRLLGYLASSHPRMPVLALGTYRSGELDPGTPLRDEVAAIARSARHIPLEGLAPGDLTDLVRSVTDRGDDVDPALLHHLTGGNPLFARELVRLLDSQGNLPRLASDGLPPVPATVHGVLARRLDRLSDDCRALLETGAVVGDEFNLHVAEAVTGMDRERLLELLGEALVSQLVKEAGVAEYRFVHPLVRASLYDRLGVSRRVRLHERVGLALEARRAQGQQVDVASLAHHFAEAASGGSAGRAAAYAVEAAEAAMSRFAYESAVLLYAQALEALDLDASGADWCAVLLGLGAAQASAGDRAAARRSYLSAAVLARRAGRPAQLAEAALGIGGGGGFEVTLGDREQIELLEEARAALGPQPSILRALVTARLSVALSLSGALDHRLKLSEEALAMARELGDSAALAYALCAHCDAIAGPAFAERRLEEAEEIVSLARSIGDRATELLGRRLRVVALFEVGETASVDAEIEAYARLAGLVRQPLYQWYVPLWRATRALMRGELGRSREFGEQAAAIGAQAQSGNAAVLAQALLWYVEREAGHLDNTPALEPLLQLEPMLGTQVRVTVTLVFADAGRREEARARLVADAALIRALPLDSEWIPAMFQLTEVIAHIGGHTLAQWAYEALLPHRRLFGVEGIGAAWAGSVERALGLLASALGRRPDAEAHFDAGVAANRAAGSPLFVARTLRDAGVALGDRERLAAALSAYRDLGIEGQVAELEARLGAVAAPNVFRCEGAVWTLAFDGKLVRVKHVKGLHDLAVLLARRGQEVTAAELAAAPGAPPQADLGERLDERATRAYKARLRELEAELALADAAGDAARSEGAQKEYDALVAQLAGAYGLGGRRRRIGGSDERARQAVSWRVRDALTRIERVHPELARHLRDSVRTGTLCVYDPGEPVEWSL